MLSRRQPTYEVNFLERDDQENSIGRRWVSAAVSGFSNSSSRHQQVERVLGFMGSPLIEGDFKMRRMRDSEVCDLLKNEAMEGGTPVSHVQDADGLTAQISYPEGEDLRRVRDEHRETVATWLSSTEMVRSGMVEVFGHISSGLGIITPENTDAIEASIRDQRGPIYRDGQASAEAGQAAV